MPRFRMLAVTLRLRGVAGAWRLLTNNVYATNRCLRLRLDASGWQSDLPRGISGPIVVRRGRLEELRQWREIRAEARLPLDFFEDLTHELEWFYLGFWNEEIAHILWVADGET